MNNQFNPIRPFKVKEYLTERRLQASVWQHPFELKEARDQSFTIFFARGLSFYLGAVLAMTFLIPIIYTTALSINAMCSDPYETFMLVFSLVLNGIRIYAAKVIYDYVRDAWRQVRYDSFDQMITVENKSIWLGSCQTQVFHLSDVAGIEIKTLKMTDMMPAAASYDEDENQACEVFMRLRDGRAVILFPRVESIQEARGLFYKIYGITGLKLLTNVASLYRR
ncbi:MAG: hypothetical protein KKB51_11750 [Candidatus Riflebacteria bacterium]|nr:hypothetical protein [Candidatus Riflebacteria bacterium]